MGRTRPIGVVVALWMLASCLPAQAVLLRYTPKAGTVVTRKFTDVSSFVFKSETLGKTIRSQRTETRVERLEVLGQEKGGYKVQETERQGVATVTASGQKGARKRKLPPTSSLTIYDDRGRVISVLSKASATSGSRLDAGDFAALGTIAFPDQEVKPGDTWSDETSVPMGEGMPELIVKVNCRLLGIVTHRGRSCAKIRTSLSGPMTLELSQLEGFTGFEGSADGTFQGTLTDYYDYTTSSWLDSEAKFSLSLSMVASVPSPDGGVQSVPLEARATGAMTATVVK